jgi:hypothetical protein
MGHRIAVIHVISNIFHSLEQKLPTLLSDSATATPSSFSSWLFNIPQGEVEKQISPDGHSSPLGQGVAISQFLV